MKSKLCRMCGECCRKGGPALHSQDANLVKSGILGWSDLVCLRKGELARASGNDQLVPLAQELIKLAPAATARPYDWTCRFLTRHETCFIYSHRPAECQALECQQPQALLEMSGKDLLSRQDLLTLVNAPDWLSELVAGHEQECAYERLGLLAASLDQPGDQGEQSRLEFLRIIEYDRAFRDLLVEKAAVDPLDLNFLLGRPLLQTVIMFGLDARQSADGIILVQTGRM